MKKTIAFIFTTVLLNLVYSQSFENAKKELQNENFLRAKQEFLSVYRSDNSMITAFYLGNAYLQLGATDSAYFYYRKTETGTDAFAHLAKARLALMDHKDSNEVKAHIEKALSISKRKTPAEVYFQAGYLTYRPKAASISQYIGYIERASEMEPNNIYYGLVIGDLLLDMHEGGKAMTQYELMESKDPNNFQLLIRMGRLWYASTNYENAIKYLEKANSMDSGSAILHKELGELYYLTRQYEKAGPEFKKYIVLDNNNSRAKITYIGFLFQLKEYPRAIGEINMFLPGDSTNYVYYRILAFSYFEVKKYIEAQTAMNKFWRYVGDNKVSGMDYDYSGKIAGACGDTAAAIKFIKIAVTMDSTNAEWQTDYATALFNAKRNPESITEFKKRMLMSKPGALDYYYLGLAYYNTGDFINADTTFGEFVKNWPKSPTGYLWRAKSKIGMEDPKNLKGLSVPDFMKYIELASTDTKRNSSGLIEAYQYLAYLALANKENAKAKEYFGKILEIDPANANAKEELKKIK